MRCFIKFIYYYKFILIEEAIILLQIIFIDIILAADNAIIIGLIAANFVPKYRKQIILWGVAGALVFKVIFAIFATYLFEFYFIKILGGLLLICLSNDMHSCNPTNLCFRFHVNTVRYNLQCNVFDVIRNDVVSASDCCCCTAGLEQ